jgi:hypothetical protein
VSDGVGFWRISASATRSQTNVCRGSGRDSENDGAISSL